MVDVRTSGFDSPAQLREHLAEIDEDRDAAEEFEIEREASSGDARRQIVALRRDVAALRRQMDALRQSAPPRDEHPWLRVTMTLAGTALLGNLVYRLRGTA